VSTLGGLVVLSDRTGICKAKMHEAGAAALKEAADELLQIASETVPVSPLPGGGFLRDTGKVEVDEAGPSAQVGYTTGPGSSDGRARGVSLAVMVHEITTTKTGNVVHSTGRAKWLEMAAKENAMRLGVKIGMSIKGKMR